jgi:Histidine kinase-, DNA gyrase B-, and HSP90-like ATPase/His Kinase A (phospho-acceptor) domain
MTSTIRDEDTALLRGVADMPRVGHFYLDVGSGRLHSLNDVARQWRAAGVPIVASDTTAGNLRDRRGGPVAPKDLPAVIARREGKPAEADYILILPGQPDRQLNYCATPLKDAAGRVGAVMISVLWQAPPPDWSTMAGLAHDLRTPLQSLQMTRHVLEFRTLPEKQRVDALERIGGAVERTLQIAQELLEWCRNRGAVGHGPVREWFALEPLLREAVGEHVPAAAEKGLTLDATLGAIRGWQILSDRGRLARILANLLVNAVRYTPAGGHVNLGAAWEEQSGSRDLILDVHDTGAGISPEEQESIFHPFERGQTGRDQDSTGSGVGLSVVDRLTSELGLRCDVRSAAGQGSQFRVHVPQQLLRTAAK